jgi:hypothetical protein
MMIEAQTVAQTLREVEDLKRRSRRAREQGKLDLAADALRRAIELVEPQIASHSESSKDFDGFTSQNLRDLALQLADCYGSLAGIRRRQNDLAGALEFYAKGRALEQNKAYGINSTYNQVQWLVIQVLLDRGLVVNEDAEFRNEISKVLAVFSEQIGKDPQDPWLRSDKGLLQTLLGQETEAQRSWREMDAASPLPAVYKSGLAVLEELSKALPDHRGLNEAIGHFRMKLGES